MLPKSCGVVHWKGEEDVVNLKTYMMGNTYAQAFGQGLKHMNAKVVNMSQNRLSMDGTLHILKGLNPGVLDIDLSNNKLGSKGLNYICEGI